MVVHVESAAPEFASAFATGLRASSTGGRRGDLREGGARSFRGAGIRSVARARPQPSRV